MNMTNPKSQQPKSMLPPYFVSQKHYRGYVS